MISNTLLKNKIVIMPSDTVWGIFSIASKLNLLKINKIKKSPIDKKISIMFSDVNQAMEYVDPIHWSNLRKIKNGETFILKSSEKAIKKFGWESIGVRIVKEFSNLIKETGPLFTTSANMNGEETPISYAEIINIFEEKVDLIVKGKQKKKKPSRIISYINNQKGEKIRK